MPAFGRIGARVLRMLAWGGPMISLAWASLSSAGCGGRVTVGAQAGVQGSDSGPAIGPGAAPDGSTGGAQDAAAARCTTPGIYLVTSPYYGGSASYSLAVFDPTTGGVQPLGPIVAPPPPCTAELESVAVTRSGRITVGCGGDLVRLDTDLAATSPIYEWPRTRPMSVDGGVSEPAPWGWVEMTALGFPDGGQQLLGLGSPIGLGEIDFDASSPLGDGGFWVLGVSGAVLPTVGPFDDDWNVPLAATGDGRLFGLGYSRGDPAIVQIDPSTAEAVGQVDVPVTSDDVGQPFAFWGGDFYTFPTATADAGAPAQAGPFAAADGGTPWETDIVRLHPGATARETVGRIDAFVAAASSSPCAPTQ